MNEKTEIAKTDYENAKQMIEIYDNPVVKMLVGLLHCKNPIGSGMEATIRKIISDKQKEKEIKLFEAIISDGTITLDQLKDIDVVYEFVMVYNAVMHLLQNEKIIFFANLFKNTVTKQNKNTDIFQESLERLTSLSYREIEVLCLMHECKEEYFSKNVKDESKNNYYEDVQSIWKNFLNKAEERFGLSQKVVTSIVTGIARTGFCEEVNILYPGGTAKCFCTSEYFEEFYNDVCKTDIFHGWSGEKDE